MIRLYSHSQRWRHNHQSTESTHSGLQKQKKLVTQGDPGMVKCHPLLLHFYTLNLQNIEVLR